MPAGDVRYVPRRPRPPRWRARAIVAVAATVPLAVAAVALLRWL